MQSQGFPGEEISTHDEIVDLSETSDTLELLFQFMYPQPQPDLEKLFFNQLAALAEAAEKYHVYSALQVCRLCMKAAVANDSSRSLTVLGYGSRHGYMSVCDVAAPETIGSSTNVALSILGRDVFISWVLSHLFFASLVFLSMIQARYCELWDNILTRARVEPHVVLHRGRGKKCRYWEPFRRYVTSALGNRPETLQRVEKIFARRAEYFQECNHCHIRSCNWERSIYSAVFSVEKFSTLMEK
jgi:hypothetical protein